MDPNINEYRKWIRVDVSATDNMIQAMFNWCDQTYDNDDVMSFARSSGRRPNYATGKWTWIQNQVFVFKNESDLSFFIMYWSNDEDINMGKPYNFREEPTQCS
jgi:hypothetical protein